MKTILICDDDNSVREAYKLILGEKYNLKLASTGQEALASLKLGSVHLIILDLKMPEMDGLEVLKKIRETAPKIPVIISTGYRSTETAQEAARLGCNDYLMKPFDPKDVLEMVERSLKN